MNKPLEILTELDRQAHESEPDLLAPPRPQRRPFVGFDREQTVYAQAHRDLLSRAEGSYVVVVDDVISEPVPNFDEAMRLGYARFGLGPLYIKQVLAEERPIETTRNIGPCRP